LAAVGQGLGGLGVLGFVVWFVWHESNRDVGELDAQTDKAAIALIQENRAERKEMREEMGGLRERVAVLEHERRSHQEVLQVHAAWDMKVIEALHRLDPSLDLHDAPPLYPPHHRSGAT
jgi:hypothetical protein